jgi:hypothetical protein
MRSVVFEFEQVYRRICNHCGETQRPGTACLTTTEDVESTILEGGVKQISSNGGLCEAMELYVNWFI